MSAQTGSPPVDWNAVRAVLGKDLRAVRRSKSVLYPMLLVPLLLLVIVPFLLAAASATRDEVDITNLLVRLPGGLADPILMLPVHERLVVLINGYLVAPLFLIVPLMVSAVLAADTFAGEKDRKTLESLLHLPVSDRDLFLGKTLASFLPAVAVSWVGFVLFAVAVNGAAWPVMHRVFVPTRPWLVVIFWVAPGVALFGLGLMVRISARARSSQEANQLGGAVVLPLIFLAMGQSTGLLLAPVSVALAVGALLWLIALLLMSRSAARFTRDRLATQI